MTRAIDMIHEEALMQNKKMKMAKTPTEVFYAASGLGIQKRLQLVRAAFASFGDKTGEQFTIWNERQWLLRNE